MRFSSLVLAFVILCVYVTDVKAQLVVVSQAGELEWNVLSEQIVLSDTSPGEVSVTKIADLAGKPNRSSIDLAKVGDNLNMVVTTDNQEKKLEVTDVSDKIIEIEERPSVSRLAISTKDGKFVFTQNQSQASTILPISIDPKEAKITVKTNFGESNLAIFPQQAAMVALRSKVVSSLSQDSEIIEEDGSVSYKLSGEKHFPFYSLYTYSVPVDTYVSTTTGEIVKIDSPTWYKYLSFLFV